MIITTLTFLFLPFRRGWDSEQFIALQMLIFGAVGLQIRPSGGGLVNGYWLLVNGYCLLFHV